MFASDVRERFTAMAQLAEEDIDLLAAALLIAKEEDSAADVVAGVREVERMAARLEDHVGRDTAFHNAIYALNHLLFVELGFHGDTETPDDPANCLLHRVLAERKGIPISLSIVYLEVGRRVGLRLEGVAFPGHFLVRYKDEEGLSYLDPFHGGRMLLREDLDALLDRHRREGALDPRLLAPVGTRALLMRLLNNLKSMHFRRGDLERTLLAVERIVILNPASLRELRDRGLLYGMTGHREAAIADLEEYLSLRPQAPDAPRIQRRLEELQGGAEA